MRKTSLYFSILAVCCTAVANAGATADFLAENWVVGFSVRSEKITRSGGTLGMDLDCAKKVLLGSVRVVAQRNIESKLALSEQSQADTFFASESGQRMIKIQTLNYYKQVGEKLPYEYPVLSDADKEVVDKFLTTSVFNKIFKLKVLEGPDFAGETKGLVLDAAQKCKLS